jgi:DNA repair exonuclease SbcCD nuclease subunit
MTALVTADLHFSAKKRDAYRFEAARKIGKLAQQKGVDEIIILGDLTEEKDYHPATLVNEIVDLIHWYSSFCRVVVSRGNHDYTQIDCPFFQFLRRIERVKWINTMNRIELSIGDCLFLPHTRDYKKDWAQLPHLDELDWIFAHNTFEGASSEHGKRLSGIPTEFFDGAHVISGDVHTPQDVGSVTYVGAPYTVDFGDDYQPRVLLLKGQWKTRSEKSIPIAGPQKRLIEITPKDIDNLPDFIRRTDVVAGDIVKARITLSLQEQEKWFAIRDKVKRSLSDLGMEVHLVQPVTTAKTRSLRLERVKSKSDERIIEEFAKANKASDKSLKVGLDIAREG